MFLKCKKFFAFQLYFRTPGYYNLTKEGSV